MDNGTKIFLGDCVYAEHDGFNIVLSAMRNGALHTITLDPHVLLSLRDFAIYCGYNNVFGKSEQD